MNAILMQIGLPTVAFTIIAFFLGICLVVIVNQIVARARSKTFEQDMQRQIEGAKRESENIIKSAQLEAAAETIRKKERFAREADKIRAELRESELRLSKREDLVERQNELIQQREDGLAKREQEIEQRLDRLGQKEKELAGLIAQQRNQLLKITAMNIDEARELLLQRLEEQCEHEMSSLIQRKVDEASETAVEKSREVISSAIQRYAAEQTCEATVSTVEIPNDDMKGRIIGREGRNI
ncbi:MAG: Rnase Y domain-containing protein, partial [Planctomycetota bacterium]